MSKLKSAQESFCALDPFSISKQIPEWMVLVWGAHPDVFHCLSKLSSLLDMNASAPGSTPKFGSFSLDSCTSVLGLILIIFM